MLAKSLLEILPPMARGLLDYILLAREIMGVSDVVTL